MAKKRIISIVTSVMMLLTMSSVGAFAAEEVGNDAAVQPAEDEMVLDAAGEEDAVQAQDVEAAVTGTPIKVEASLNQPYTGEAIDPVIKVTNASTGAELTENQDYTVKKTNANENAYIGVAAGQATVQVDGIGDYTGTKNLAFNIVAPSKPAPVTGLRGIAGYKAVKLVWNPSNADTFYITRADQANNTRNIRGLVDTKSSAAGYAGVTSWAEFSKAPFWENTISVAKYKTYTYAVRAGKYYQTLNADGSLSANKVVLSDPVYVNKGCVNKMRVTFKVKRGVTLKSYNSKAKLKVKKGQKITAEGFGGGKYYFTKNGHDFRIMTVRVRKAKAKYVKNWDYSKEEAEYFVNKHPYTKSTSGNAKLIWVSEYCQHVYIFKKNAGKWVLEKNWKCSTGSAAAPSPTGNCKIHKRIYSRHHILHWSCFSTLNALHGIKPVKYAGYNWTKYLGQPKSNGCIRNSNDNATWIWNNCGIGTRVLVY